MENTFASKINYYFPTLLDSFLSFILLLLKNSQHSTTVMHDEEECTPQAVVRNGTAQHICLFVMLEPERDKQQVFFSLCTWRNAQEDRVSHVWRRTRHNLNI